MKMLRLRIRKWFFSYLDYILAILVTLGLSFVKDLPSWLLVFPLVIALIGRGVRDMVRGKEEELAKLADSVDRLSAEFLKFTECSYYYSICSIATDLISKYRGRSEKIKGWVAYFDMDSGMPAQLFKNYGSFEKRRRKYVENPKGKESLSALIREFLDLVGLHYEMHINLLEMVRDTGDLGWEQRYNKFKREYDEFYRNLRGVAPDLEKAASIKLMGTSYYDFAKDFPKAVLEI